MLKEKVVGFHSNCLMTLSFSYTAAKKHSVIVVHCLNNKKTYIVKFFDYRHIHKIVVDIVYHTLYLSSADSKIYSEDQSVALSRNIFITKNVKY